MQTFDLAILGAGPGGSAAALAGAELGLSVALVDPRLAPERAGVVKPCGEGLMPAGVDTLVRLGLAPEELGASFPGVSYFAPGAEPLALDFPTPGIAIHRGVLQAALDERVRTAPGVERFALAARVDSRPGSPSEPIVLRTAACDVAARTLVVADGGAGRAAPWLRGGPRHSVGEHSGARHNVGERSGRTGLRAHCEPREPLARVEVHFGPTCEVYLTPLPPTELHPRGLVNVVLLFERLPEGVRGGVALLAHALAEHPRAALHVGERVGLVEARALDWDRPEAVSDGRSFLVGDASGGVDPVLGCGTTVALRTGVAAAAMAEAWLRGAPARRVAADYTRVQARETHARRRVAALLIAASRQPWRARALVGLARALPGPTRALVGLAARVEPLFERGTRSARHHGRGLVDLVWP